MAFQTSVAGMLGLCWVMLLLAGCQRQWGVEPAPPGAPAWEITMRADLAAMVEKLQSELKPWPVPERVFAVEDYGAVADGKTVHTQAIQAAIDACSAAGGGVVLFAKGDYVTGTIDLKSDVMLEVAEGSRILGSTNLQDYPDRVPQTVTVMDTHMKMKLSLIYAERCERIGIRGKGIIDGRGTKANFPGKQTIGPIPGRPFLIRVIECKQVTLDGIELRDAAGWMQNYIACDDLLIENITVHNQANWNNDGLDIDGCKNVIVRNCLINSEDDAMCFKGASGRTMENVLVENCVFYSSCNALKFGTDTQGGLKNVVVRNVELGGTPKTMKAQRHHDASTAITWATVDGGDVENTLITGVTIARNASPIFLRLGQRGRVLPKAPRPAPGKLQSIVIENVAGTASKRGSMIAGIEGHPIQDVVIRNVNITVPGGVTEQQAAVEPKENKGAYPDANVFGRIFPGYGFYIRHARDVQFQNVQITPQTPDARQEFFMGTDAVTITHLK